MKFEKLEYILIELLLPCLLWSFPSESKVILQTQSVLKLVKYCKIWVKPSSNWTFFRILQTYTVEKEDDLDSWNIVVPMYFIWLKNMAMLLCMSYKHIYVTGYLAKYFLSGEIWKPMLQLNHECWQEKLICEFVHSFH